MPEQSMLATQVSFYFCAKYTVDVLLALSACITMVRLFPPGVGYAGHSLSELVSTRVVNDAAFLLGCSKQHWTQGYWSSSSTADNPVKSTELHFAFIVESNLLLPDHYSATQNKQLPPNLIHQNVFFGFQLLVQMTALLSSFV